MAQAAKYKKLQMLLYGHLGKRNREVVAKRAGFSGNTMCRYLNDPGQIRVDTLIKLCKELEITGEELLAALPQL